MKIRHTKAKAGEDCAWCAYPFDDGDNAYVDSRNDNNVYCCVNCATKHRCQISLAQFAEMRESR